MSNNAIHPPPPPYRSQYEEEPHREPSVVVKIEGAAASPATSTSSKSRSSNGSNTGWTKIVALIISLVSVTAAAAAWNVQQHDDIKGIISTQDAITRKDLAEDVEKRYAPKDNFVEVKMEQKYIKEKIDKIDNKLDELYEFLSNRQRQNKDDR